MKVKTTLIALILCLVCNAFLPLLSLPSTPNAYTALAFKPTNNKNTNNNNTAPISNPPVVVNHPPVANAGLNQTVNETTAVTLNGIASDPDLSDKLSYSWKQIAGPQAIKFPNINTPNPSFIAPAVSSDRDLKFSLTVKDDKGAESNNPAIVTITVKHINHPPVANAGSDQTVNPRDVVSLDGSKSRDADSDDTLNYLWTQTSGPIVKLDDANSSIAAFTAPSNISANTTLGFRLTVKDSKNAIGTADVKVIDKYIPPTNKPPVANAGLNQKINAGETVRLNGTKSTDHEGRIISYLWKQIAGPAVTLDGIDTAIATFTAPSNISSDTDLAFKLTVTDDKNVTNSATVKVTVRYIPPPNQPPVANAGQDKTVNAGDSVTLDGSGSRDPDGSITSYSWIQTAGPSVTLNSSNTTNPTFTAPSISSDTTLKFSLTVKDDKGATSNNPAIVSVIVKAAPSLKPAPTTQAPSSPATNTTGQGGNATNAPPIIQTAKGYSFIKKWGSSGSADGQFSNPWGVVLDSSGNVYVS